ncbi:hypothetical protein [Pelobacter propionicus]|uniref:Uncharacterized protein n=1 Tax=Pelobacter propionicus (strain DSM 2379 / NBRC 103807 / OttBd1) TaxID=338966 RepID=A1AQ86_PELPD|nr:hypothetical protein [Pelobacter propionicus]ABK99506.1 hypothetical protein Ppro_1896 [Pelobacter propionicus DSM 2379]
MRRTPELLATILQLIYTKTFGNNSFNMYTISRYELIMLSGMRQLTAEYLSDVKKCLRTNDYVLLRLPDYFVVTEILELEALRGIPYKLILKYLSCSNKSIENEYSHEMAHKYGFGYYDEYDYDV